MNKQLQVLTKEGQRVLTTQQLAEVYETSKDNIQMNYKRNENRFIEGKHFFKLEGEDLKTFKNEPTLSWSVGKTASSLMLWTEKGADRHCKILDTDKAWEQFDNLEETYFKVKEQGLLEAYLQMSEEDRAIAYFNKAKESKQLEADNKKKDELLLIAGEKTTIVDEFLESDGLYGVDAVAKTLAIKNMGRNNLYDYLRQNKIMMTDIYLDKNGDKKAGAKHYEVYSQYVNQQQYFEHRSRKVQAGFKTIEQLVAMFTPKGIQWIIKRLQKDGYIAKKDLKTVISELSQVA